MSEGLIEKVNVLEVSHDDADPIGDSFTVERTCAVRGTVKFSGAAKLQLDEVEGATTAAGYLNEGDNLVADVWTPFVFEARQGRTYQLRVSGATVTVTAKATVVFGTAL